MTSRSLSPAQSAEPNGQPVVDFDILRDDPGFQVHITRRAIARMMRPGSKRGLPREPSGYFASLILIGANPGISPSAIAGALFIDMPNVAVILRRMGKAGLVERHRGLGDRRRASLVLTAAGEARLAAATTMTSAMRARIAQGLDEDEVRTLNRLLQKLQQSVSGGADS